MGQLNPFGKKEEKQTIMLVGPEQSGKCSIAKKLKELDENQSQTLGFQCETVKYKTYEFTVCDIFRNSRVLIYQRPQFQFKEIIYVFVIDSSSKDSLTELKKIFMNFVGLLAKQNKPVLIYLNKSDLSIITPEEVKSALELQTLGIQKTLIQPCNALTGEGVVDGLEWLYTQLI